MIKVSVFYPNRKDATFDIDYYCQRHMPLVQRLVGSALKGVSVDHGLSGGEPSSPALYLAIGHLLFESVGDFERTFAPHAPEIMADVPKYTNLQPMIQISEVAL